MVFTKVFSPTYELHVNSEPRFNGGKKILEVLQTKIGTTTANVTILPTCNSLTTVQAEIYVQVYGINGELTQVYYTFQ